MSLPIHSRSLGLPDGRGDYTARQISGSIGFSAALRRIHRRCYLLVLSVSDTLMLGIAFYLAFSIRFEHQVSISPEVSPPPHFYELLVLILIPACLSLYVLFGLFSWENLVGGTAEYARSFYATSVSFLLVILATFLEPDFVVARAWLIFSWVFSVFLVIFARFCLRRCVYFLRTWGYFLVPTAIVGVNQEAVALLQQLGFSTRSSGLQILGCVNGGGSHSFPEGPILPVLGSLRRVENIIQELEIESLIVCVTALEREELLELHERISALKGVQLRLSSGLYEVLTTGVRVKTFGSVPLISLDRLRLKAPEIVLKTIMEYSVTLLGLLFLAPVMFLIGIMIKLDSPGPVLHRRRVLGLGGKEFDAFKFRTMRIDGEEILQRRPELLAQLEEEGKLKIDPRVTRTGIWLRRFSLDELPQLFNVLLGQMSLVGPRMIAPEEGGKFGRLKWNLLTVKPGITGLWQVSGRSDLSYEERVRLDMHYIRNYSIWMDLQILLIQTPMAVLKTRGAY